MKILREADQAPVNEVAKKHGISDVTIYAWRKRLAFVNRALTFVPVRVIPDAAAEPVIPAIEVVLQGGQQVRVRTGFDQITLKRVLVVLEGLPC